jgi:hypothetical protein
MSKKVHKNTKYCSFKKFVMFRCFKNVKCTPGILISLGSTPEYVILDDFLSFYPGYTPAIPWEFLWSRIFHILDKSAIIWCNCSLPRV